MTALIVGFLVIHGLLHLAIWLPHPEPDPAHPAPFQPDHSGLLTAVAVPAPATHALSLGLAVGATAAYLLAATALLLDAAWAPGITAAAALLGLTLKILYFHPWLSLGLLLDVAVLGSALIGWPVSLP